MLDRDQSGITESVVGVGDTLYFLRRKERFEWERDPGETGFALCRYTRDCRLDTVLDMKRGLQPYLSDDGTQMLAVEAANDSTGLLRIVVYDIAAGTLSYPFDDSVSRWNPVQISAARPLYYLRHEQGTAIYQYTPESGEERVTNLAGESQVIDFSVAGITIYFQYLDRSGPIPVVRSDQLTLRKKQ